MWLYQQLCRFLPEGVARVCVALWFAVLLVAVLFCSFEPQADFNYGNL